MGAGEALRGAGAQRVRERREWEGRSMCQGAGAQRERGEGGVSFRLLSADHAIHHVIKDSVQAMGRSFARSPKDPLSPLVHLFSMT